MAKIEQKCCEMVRGAGKWGGWHKQPCTRAAKVIRDDKPYCGIHDPVAEKARRDKLSAKYEAKWNHERQERNATAARAAAERAVIDAAKALEPHIDFYLRTAQTYRPWGGKAGNDGAEDFDLLALRAALSALAALETPNDTKEPPHAD